MRKVLLLGILFYTTISLVSLPSKADTSEMKTIENEKYNWKMKIPKCWELSKSHTERDLQIRHLLDFTSDECKKSSFKIEGLTIKYYYFPINYKRIKLRHKTENLTIGGRPAISHLWFAGAPKEKEGNKFQVVDWYVLISCQRGHRELKFRDNFNIKDIDFKKETVKNFPTLLLRKIASTFECT